jgi:hypothetical protein
MKISRPFISFALWMVLASLPGASQTLTKPKPTGKPQGMVGYALSRFNPNDKDFGGEVTNDRAALVDHTINNAYFWSNCVAFGLLAGMGLWVVLLSRGRNKAEIIASHLIAQLWNGRVSDRYEIERRTRLYNELVDRHNEAAEKTLNERVLYKRKRANERTSGETPAVQSATPVSPAETGVAAQSSPASSTTREPAQLSGTSDSPAQITPETRPSTATASPKSSSNDDAEQLRRELDASRQESRALKGQVQALQNRESNLIIRLNQATELQKQNASREAQTTAK